MQVIDVAGGSTLAGKVDAKSADVPPEALCQWIAGAVEPTADARLRVVAGMAPEMRNDMHAILGFAQMLRMKGGLDAAQSQWVDAIVAGGTRLLMKVQEAMGLTDLDAAPPDAVTDVEADFIGGLATNVAAERTNANPPERATRALQVLVVDDVELNRDIAASFIQSAGHIVTLCEGGDAAVATAATKDFDVILMDVRMPDVDGLEASRRIRALPGARGRVPIVALTAQTTPDQLDACRAAGMTGHLAKPFRYDTLRQAILRVTSEHAAMCDIQTGDSAAPAETAIIAARKEIRPESAAADSATRANTNGHRLASFAATYLRSARAELTVEQTHPRIARDRDVDPVTVADLGPAKSSASAASSAWIDIANPWNVPVWNGSAASHGSQRSYILDTQFDVRLTSIGPDRRRQLVDKQRTYEPPRDRDQYEFHWLLFTDPGANAEESFTATCDLWRWSGSTWRSISSAGAQFTPDEMYGHGWRYCGPCVEKTARVEVA